MDQIYNITAKEKYYEDPPADGWESSSSCMTDSEDDLESWKNRLYELQGHRCARITKSLKRLSSQIRALPISEGLTDPEELIVLDSPKMVTLESAFGATIAKGWNSRKKYIPSWEACQKFLYLRFGGQLQTRHSWNKGQRSPQEYLEHCYEAWKHVSHTDWVHRVVHI